MSRGHEVVSLGTALRIAASPEQSTIECNAASGPAGVVELSNDPRKAILMNYAYPSF